MNGCCTCPTCQRSIRLMIERLYDRRPRWMRLYTVKARAGLGWVDHDLYLLIFGRMVELGLLIKSNGPDEEYPLYLSAKVMARPRVLAESTERRAA